MTDTSGWILFPLCRVAWQQYLCNAEEPVPLIRSSRARLQLWVGHLQVPPAKGRAQFQQRPLQRYQTQQEEPLGEAAARFRTRHRFRLLPPANPTRATNKSCKLGSFNTQVTPFPPSHAAQPQEGVRVLQLNQLSCSSWFQTHPGAGQSHVQGEGDIWSPRSKTLPVSHRVLQNQTRPLPCYSSSNLN